MRKGTGFAIILCVMFLSLLAGRDAFGSGFAIIEQSVSGLGNAYAGGAGADDASTIFFNPAGLTKLPGNQAILGAHVIIPSAKFENEGSTHLLQPRTGVPLLGGGGGDGGETRIVPNFYVSGKVAKDLYLGLGVSAPYGLATEYDSSWVGRYHAVKSKLLTVNINPSIAYRINQHLSIGGGVSFEYAEAELTNSIDFGTLDAIGALGLPPGALGLTPQGADGFVDLKGDDWDVGFNLGLLVEFTPDTRAGLAYRSQIHHTLAGTADFSGVPAGLAPVPVFRDTDAFAKLTTPDTVSLNFFHQFNPQWKIMADITWTNWSVFNELRVRFDNPRQPDSVVTTDWDDSFRYSLGVTYMPTPAWTLRGGIAYDETPVPDEQRRTPRIPDEDRFWLAFGVGYKISKMFSVDVGYVHIFVDDPNIDKSPVGEDAVRGGLKGTYDANVNIFSAQVVLHF